ncbi:MAG TPA: LPS assembly protein LptD, partial [Usitatibacter sp.]|nr:LPS assembly protein LptD [Usitatibacter sp.]
MRPRRTRTLVFALACATAPQLAGAQLPDGVRLRLEHQLHMAPPRLERDSAKFLEADRVQAQGRDEVVATGNVVLRQLGASIRADRLEYDGKDQAATATGHVQLERNGDKASGPRLYYRLDNGTGEMDTPVFEFPKTGERRIATRGVAARAELEDQQKSRLFAAEYTSCPAPRDDWFLRVKELDVDGSRNVGAAYNSTVYFLGVPILYMPYVSFPLDNKRRSGFLAPTFGSSGQSGFDASLPYYWNIAENLDTTITPKIFTKRGIQVADEFRYLEPKFSGQFDGEFLPSDRITRTNRWFVGLHHMEQFGHGWSAAVNAQEVSDDNYFRDLSTKIALTSQTNLPHDAAIAYNDDTWSFMTRALSYETLQDPNGPPVPIPYRILPQMTLTGSRQNVHGFDWQVSTEASSFSHPTLVEGERFILNPSLSMPLRRSYGYVVPKIEYYYLRYNLRDHITSPLDDGPLSLPIASVDSGLYFDRSIEWGGRGFDQTLEPRLYYLYVPFRDQSHLPNFTTAEKDFSFAQIFTDNRFVGGDRVGDANQITFGLTSRMIESATGLERLTASIGQVYYF